MDSQQLKIATQNMVDTLVKNKETIISIVTLFICILLVISMILFLGLRKVQLTNQCKSMNKTYKELAKIQPIGVTDTHFTAPLAEYYIKGSFNSCCPGNYSNAWVDLCALTNVIKQGCRVLDFQIFNIDNKPIVAASSNTNNYSKGTWNYLDFAEVIQLIGTNAFSPSTCPNYSDPLFLNFRLQTTNTIAMNTMAQILRDETTLSGKYLGSNYSYESRGKNLGNKPLSMFRNKVTIFLTESSGSFRETDLWEWVNMCGQTPVLTSYNFSKIIYSNDVTSLINNNKKKLCICYPDPSGKAENYSSAGCQYYGVQICLMNYQTKDSYLDSYNSFFENQKEGSYAFVRKPLNLRFKSNPVNQAPSVPPNQYLGSRTNTAGAPGSEITFTL
jgi:hypothetical protein